MKSACQYFHDDQRRERYHLDAVHTRLSVDGGKQAPLPIKMRSLVHCLSSTMERLDAIEVTLMPGSKGVHHFNHIDVKLRCIPFFDRT